MNRAEHRQYRLTKPPGSLGRLEELSVQLAGIFRTDQPRPGGKTLVVAAADHGVVAQGVTGYPQVVTAQMVRNILDGGAAISVMARNASVALVVVDAGVATPIAHHPQLKVVGVAGGTADMTRGAAMTLEQAETCVIAGVRIALETAEGGADVIGTGDMGIGNTTASSAIAAGVDLAARQILPFPVVSAVLVATLLVMTRAIHTEGFLDCCDGLFGGFTPERRLEILRDSHVGAFAVIGGVALVMLKWTLLVGIPNELRAGLLTVFPCLSRAGMLWTMAVFAYARQEGMGTAFLEGASRWQIATGTVTAAAAAILLIGAPGALLLAAAVGLALALGRWISSLLGGMTGDGYGAVNEVTEVAVLLLGIALYTLAPEIYWPTVW